MSTPAFCEIDDITPKIDLIWTVKFTKVGLGPTFISTGPCHIISFFFFFGFLFVTNNLVALLSIFVDTII